MKRAARLLEPPAPSDQTQPALMHFVTGVELVRFVAPLQFDDDHSGSNRIRAEEFLVPGSGITLRISRDQDVGIDVNSSAIVGTEPRLVLRVWIRANQGD